MDFEGIVGGLANSQAIMITLLNTEPISKLVDGLPARSITTMVLGALDFVVPGQWCHYPNFHDMAKAVTGETREGKLQVICNHADQLYNEGERGAQRAVWIYQSADGNDRMLAAASLAHQVGDSVGMLGFLSKLTPKPDTLQALDLGLKVATEALAYLNLHGLTGERFDEFERSLTNLSNESAIRMAALVTLDGLIPLGPDFLVKVTSSLQSAQGVEQNGIFAKLGHLLPGSDTTGRLGFVRNLFASVQGWMGGFVSQKGLTQEGLLSRLNGVLKMGDGKLDTLASLLDASTNYLSYTGTQTAARHVLVKSWERFRPH